MDGSSRHSRVSGRCNVWVLERAYDHSINTSPNAPNRHAWFYWNRAEQIDKNRLAIGGICGTSPF
jgi:hypothetical protein